MTKNISLAWKTRPYITANSYRASQALSRQIYLEHDGAIVALCAATQGGEGTDTVSKSGSDLVDMVNEAIDRGEISIHLVAFPQTAEWSDRAAIIEPVFAALWQTWRPAPSDYQRAGSFQGAAEQLQDIYRRRFVAELIRSGLPQDVAEMASGHLNVTISP